MTPDRGTSAALAHRLAPTLIGSASARERPITVDQTNTSVVVEETVIVKWFDPPLPDPHPGIDLLRHLAEVGFDEVPGLHGVEVCDERVVATVSEYLIGALDGWDWFVDELLADAHSDGDRASEWAGRCGALAARLHLALARPSTVIPDPVGAAPVDPELARCRRLLDEASAITTPEVCAVLAPRLDEITATIDTIAGIPTIDVQRIHDDLHVGQLLRAGDRLVVTDFDGNPIGDPDLIGHRRPTAVDVASLLQSFDHAGRVAIRRAPHRAGEIASLIAASSDAAFDAYRRELRIAGRPELFDDRLLGPLRLAQELHELVYADRHLPRWTYAPLATLTAMLPRA